LCREGSFPASFHFDEATSSHCYFTFIQQHFQAHSNNINPTLRKKKTVFGFYSIQGLQSDAGEGVWTRNLEIRPDHRLELSPIELAIMTIQNTSLNGKVCIVTGGASGYGEGLCKRLFQSG
jgi:FlaA1/EpsC-like NDP-sugar epimerase